MAMENCEFMPGYVWFGGELNSLDMFFYGVILGPCQSRADQQDDPRQSHS